MIWKKSKFYAKQQFRKNDVVNHLECAIFIGPKVVHRWRKEEDTLPTNIKHTNLQTSPPTNDIYINL